MTAGTKIWCWDDSVEFDLDGRTIQGFIRFEASPGVFEVVDCEDYEEYKVRAEDLRPGPVTLIQKAVECLADPPHSPVWIEIEEHRDYDYPFNCPYCDYENLRKQHDGCEHSHHGRWRHWKITRRIVSRLYWLGVIAGSGLHFDAHCKGCVTSVLFKGRRSYILGVSREHWRCLLVGRHWPGEPIGMGLCGKCAPCVSCGSTRMECEPGCPEIYDPRAVA